MADSNNHDLVKHEVTNSSKKEITRAGICFKPGVSKPMVLTAAKLAQINVHDALTVAVAVTTNKSK
jgi:hypothetical protein